MGRLVALDVRAGRNVGLVGQGREPRRDEAMELLRQRYARGEINKEEFDVKSRDLG